MKKRLLKRLNITWESVRKVLRQAMTATFLFFLFGAFLLWYASKLSDEYTTEIPLNMRIDGQRYRITALVSGRGSAILAQQLSLKGRLDVTLDELVTNPSFENPGALILEPESLQNAINNEMNDLSVVQVMLVPEFIPDPAVISSTPAQ